MKTTLTSLLLIAAISGYGQSKPLMNWPIDSTTMKFISGVVWIRTVKIDTVPCYMQIMYVLGDKKDPIITTVWKSGYEIKRSDSFNVTYLNDFKEPVKNKVLISTEK